MPNGPRGEKRQLTQAEKDKAAMDAMLAFAREHRTAKLLSVNVANMTREDGTPQVRIVTDLGEFDA